MRFLQRDVSPNGREVFGEDAGHSQLLSFPQKPTVRAQPEGEAESRAYPTLAANDATPVVRRGRYNWDVRSAAGRPLDQRNRLPLRGMLLSAGAVIVVVGVAVGGFVVMGHFKSQKSMETARVVTPAKADAVASPSKVAASAQPRAVKPEQVAAASPKAAATIAVPTIPVKTVAITNSGSSAGTNVRVPAPDNARWGKLADAGPKVDDPKTAPVPSVDPKEAAPKTLAYASPTPAADASIEKAVAAPRPVDKSVTASLPKAETPQDAAPQDTTPPGVDKSYLSGAENASGAEEPVSGHRGVVVTAVKMHAGPENSSRAIGVVPAKTAVEVLSCSAWCKISYDGKQGWVYKKFLGNGGGHATAAVKPAASGAKAAATTVASTATSPAAAKPAPATGLPTAPAGSPNAAEVVSQTRR